MQASTDLDWVLSILSSSSRLGLGLPSCLAYYFVFPAPIEKGDVLQRRGLPELWWIVDCLPAGLSQADRG